MFPAVNSFRFPLVSILVPFSFLLPQEIQLSEILSVDSNIDPLQTDATRAPHCFEIKTRDMVFYVGQVEDEEEIPDPDSGIGSVTGQAWANVTRSALMPGCVTPTTSSAPPPSSSAGKKITSQPYSIHTSRGSIRELTPHYVNAECKMSRKVHEGYIVEVFEIRKQPSDNSYG